MQQNRVAYADLLKLYIAHHPGEQFSAEDVIQWGKSIGYDVTPQVDPEALAVRKMKQVIKKARFTDPQGREVPQYISVGDELPLWGDITILPHNIVQKSLNTHYVAKAVQTLAQGKTIADSYNDNFNQSGIPVQLELDGIQDAVMEEMIMKRKRSKNQRHQNDEDDELD
jgi:hypothetical protein